MRLDDGRRLSFTDRDGTSPPVVLLHPIGLTGGCWDAFAAALGGRHRVLGPDLAGHGGSDRPTGPYTIAALADDVAGLVRAESTEPVVVAGLSMGGMVALALAQRHPGLVSAVAVINSGPKVPPAFVPALEDRAGRVREGGMAALADETLARWFTPGFAEREPAVVAAVRGQLLAGDPGVHADAWLALAAADLEPGLPDLAVPLLTVTGALDPAGPAEVGARTAASVPDGQHVHLDGAGHMSPLEEPARLAAVLLAFLDRSHPRDRRPA